METKVKAICKVCDGKGGWKVKVNNWWDGNWQVCHFCDSYGFVEKEPEPLSETSFLLQYNGYKKIITDLMETFGKLLSYTTVDKASTIEINFSPKDRLAFVEFAKGLIKFAHFNKRLKIEVHQVFFYEPTDDKPHYYWRIVLKPTELSDLDGFVEFIRMWNKSRGRLRDENKGEV